MISWKLVGVYWSPRDFDFLSVMKLHKKTLKIFFLEQTTQNINFNVQL